jgi:peptidoglycan hydrolase CwlO-like protein
MKLDQEKSARVASENQLLQAEKEKSELRVDLLQMTQQVTSVQSQLKNEQEKVTKIYLCTKPAQE